MMISLALALSLLPCTDGFYGQSLAFLDDVDSDGCADFLVSSRPSHGSPGVVQLYSGATREVIYSVTPQGWEPRLNGELHALEDFDGDGVREWSMISDSSRLVGLDGGVLVRSGASGSVLFEVASRDLGLELGGHIEAVGDLDGDGCPDLLLGGSELLHLRGVSAPVYRRFTFAVSGRDGALIQLACTEQGPPAISGRARGLGDIDGDGVPDLFIHDPGQPDRSEFRAVSGSSGEELYEAFAGAVPVGDLDGDGTLDFAKGRDSLPNALAWSGYWWSGRTGKELVVAKEPKGGTVLPVGDLDGDGHEDLLGGVGESTWPMAEGSFRTLHISGWTSTGIDFWFSKQLWSVVGEPGDELFGETIASGGDLDGDGLPDLLIVFRRGHSGSYLRGYSGLTGEVLFTLPAYLGGK